MNKFLLAITLLLSIFSIVAADVQLNKTEIKNATDSGLNALNKTIDILDEKEDKIKAQLRDFFDISDATTGEKIYKSAIVVAIAAVGVFVGTHGYKLVKPVVFISGFGLGGVFFSAAFATLFPTSSAAPIIAFVVGGLILALICFYFYRIGIFILGGAGGMVLGLEIATLLQASHVVTLILIVVFAVIVGVLAMYLEKPVMIIATADFGSYMVVRAIGFFAGNFTSGSDFENLTTAQKHAFYAYLGGMIVLTIILAVIQFKYTAVGVNHGLGKDDEKDAKKATAATTAAAKPNAQKPVNMV